MARTRPPSIDFYYEDFYSGVSGMHPLAVGMYIRSICFQWAHGSVPNDPRKIQQITGVTPQEFDAHWPEVAEKMVLDGDGQWINERAQVEMEKKLGIVEKRVFAGQKGGLAKARANALAKGVAKGVAKPWQREDGRRKKEEGRRKGEAGRRKKEEDLFEQFWEVFPRGRRKSKGKAEEAFAKASALVDAETLIRRAGEYASSNEGQGDFVKMPSTWLNQRCWEDDEQAWKGKQAGDPERPNIDFREIATE